MPTFVTEGPVTKAYVDATSEGLHVLSSVKAATTTNITISTDLNDLDTLDDVNLTTGDRVLVKDQTNSAENGIYIVGDTPARSDDFNSLTNIKVGDFVFVTGGSTNEGQGFVMTGHSNFDGSGNSGTIGSDDINFTQFSGVTSTVPVNKGGTNITSFSQGDILYASGATTLVALTKGSNNQVLTSTGTNNNPKWLSYASVCFLEGTKITLPDKKYCNIEDLTLDDKVLTYNIVGLSELKDKTKISEWFSNSMKGSFSESGIRNIWINPTDSYLIINNKLRVTNHHLIHFRRNGLYYFNYAEFIEIHDELLTDEGVYEPVELIELKKDTINVYNFELDKDQTYFADNYLVHHYCKLCSGYSNII